MTKMRLAGGLITVAALVGFAACNGLVDTTLSPTKSHTSQSSGAASGVERLVPTGSKSVAICHASPGNPGAAQTIQVAASAVDAHLAHGDTMGACGAAVCPCTEPLLWQANSFGGLYCAADVSGGRLSVCTSSGQPTCSAFAGDGTMLPLEKCAACLPVTISEGTVVSDCAQVPGLIGS